MEFNVALCENDTKNSELIRENIYSLKSDRRINVFNFVNEKDLCDYIKKKNVDICFLDVNFSNDNLIEVAQDIKKTNKKCILIFLAENNDYIIDAFKLKAFDYLIKPVDLEMLNRVWNDVNERINEIIAIRKYDMEIAINNKEKVFKIKYDKILYFEKKLRKIRIVCDDDVIEYYGSFKNLCKILDEACFTQCHQSFIVNNDRIYQYSNQLLYLDGNSDVIPVSKSCIKEVKEKIMEKQLG